MRKENIYLDGEGKPFSLQRTLTEPAQVYPLKTYGTQLRLDMGLMPPISQGDTKPTIVLPLTQILTPQLHIPPMVSPIKTVNDDDDSGPSEEDYNRMRQMLDVAFQTVMAKTPKDKFDQVMDSFTSALHQISNGNTPAPNSNEEIENKLKEVEKQNRTLTHEKFLLNQDLKTKLAETRTKFPNQTCRHTRKKFRPKISKFKDFKILWQIKYQNK